MELISNGTEYIDGIKYLFKVIKYSNGKRVKRFFKAGSIIPVKVQTMQ